jgi:hypothetical protein
LVADFFKKKESELHCKACKVDGGQEQQRILDLPSSILIVTDVFNDQKMLRNLIAKFPL